MTRSYLELKAILEFDEDYLSIDFFFADTIERYFPLKNPVGKIWLAILHKNSRLGNFFFDPQKQKEQFKELPSFEESLSQLIQNPFEGLFLPIVKIGNDYLLKKNFDDFFQWIKDLTYLLQAPFSSSDAVEKDHELNDEQNLALASFFQHHWLILAGGPGRGKTYTAKQIVKSFVRQHPDCHIALAAPTGKATENLFNALLDLNLGPQIKAMTLHSLLGLSPHNMNLKKNSLLDCDLLIIDECSMMDFQLFSALLKVLERKTKVLFIGDLGQLPPVVGFSPLHLLMDLKNRFEQIGFVELKKPMRTDKKGLLQLADGILNQDQKLVEEAFSCPTVGLKELEEFYSHLESEMEGFIDFNTQLPDFKKLYQIKVIASHNVGPYGSDAINRFFLNKIAKKENRHQYLIPILFKENQEKIGVFNGKLGFLSYFHSQPVVYTRSDHKIPLALSPAFDFAFAISIHKSQGSEFDKVFLAIQEITIPTKELLYTAVSRAKKKLTIFGNKQHFFAQSTSDDEVLRKYRDLTEILLKEVNT